jgi:EmrB/QacA subfamily drug resistance transporter
MQSPSPRWVALLVATTFFMENLDATVITTALPSMAESFGVEPARLSIGISAYMLALAVCIPISGWLADRYGPRRVFSAAIIIFTLASLFCGLSTSLAQFTAARILQGIGGAMMVPVGRLVVLRNTAKRDLVNAIAIITWPGLVAPILGPPVGGFISTYLTWHWIFFLNLPLGLIALGVALWLIRGAAGAPRPFDLVGFILSGIGCSALMIGIELASQPTIDGWLVLLVLGVGLATLTLVVCHLFRAEHPLVDLSALRVQTFATTIGGGSLFRIAISSAPFLLPLMFQVAFGLSAVISGMLMLALFAGNLSMKPATSWIMRRFGFRSVLLVNGLLVALGFVFCVLLSPSTPLWLSATVLFFGGLCRSMQFTALNTLGFADVAPEHMSGATTLFSVFQQMNAGIGIAFGAVALRIAALLSGHSPETLTPFDFRIAFALVALLALLALIDIRRLPSDVGAEVSGHRPGVQAGKS